MNSNNYNCLVKLAAGGAMSNIQPQLYPLDDTAKRAALEQAATARLNTAPRFAPFATSAMAPRTSVQAHTPKPPVYPTINPATGGYRVMHRGQPIGPALPGNPNYKFRKDPLPITPYSSGQINLESLQ
jgi:hypothetical protein